MTSLRTQPPSPETTPPPLPPPPPPPPRFRCTTGNLLLIIFSTVFFVLLIYQLAVHFATDVGGMKVCQVDAENLYVEYKFINSTAIKMSANSTVKTRFHITGNVKPSPVIATYNLTAVAIEGHPISTFGRSRYSISETDGKSVSVVFDPFETILPMEELSLFKQILVEHRISWLFLYIDYSWDMRDKDIYLFPPPIAHSQYTCRLFYVTDQKNVSYPMRCVEI